MKFQCEEWYHDYGYQPVMDVDVIKMRFNETETIKAKGMMKWKKE
jgi:uncharacterized protein YcaQ